MPNLAISEELFERLKVVAHARHVTVEQQAEELLTAAIPRPAPRAALRRRFDEIAALTPRGVTQSDSVALLRKERDR
jgi:hypothetical protein